MAARIRRRRRGDFAVRPASGVNPAPRLSIIRFLTAGPAGGTAPDPCPKAVSSRNPYPAKPVIPGGFYLILALYIGVHFLLRLTLSPTLGVDEVEQAVFAQAWDPGYVFNQPPLYTWLLWGLYGMLGVGAPAHAILKYGLLALTYLFFYLASRRVLGDEAWAGLATLSLLLVAPFGWNVHQGFTHTVLLSTLCAAGFWAVLRLAERPTAGGYLLVGVLVGLGMLSKYSYAVFLVGLMMACLAVPEYRRLVLDRRVLIAAAAALLVIAPHGAWIVEQRHSAGALFATTLKTAGAAAYLDGVGRGLASLGASVITYLAPLWLVLLILFPRAVLARGLGTTPAERLTSFVVLGALTFLVAAIFLGGVTQYKARWMHPALLLVPLIFTARLAARPPSRGRLKAYGYTLAVISLIVVIIRVGQFHLGPLQDRYTRWHVPYRELAEGLAAAGFTGGTIVAGDEHTGGNLRLRFPRARVVTLRYADFVPPRSGTDGQCLVVWKADKGDGPLATIAERVLPGLGAGVEGLPVRHLDAPLYGSAGRTARLGYVLIAEGAGDCR